MMTRRTALKTIAFAASTTALARPALGAAAPVPAPGGPYQLPPLPYAPDALEPFIDARTMEIHHDRHHATYVASLNKAVAGNDELASKSVEDLIANLAAVPEGIRSLVRNHGGGHANHSFFWQSLRRNGGSTPAGPLMEAIVRRFGTFDAFKTEFSKAAMSVFGSGWAWLSTDKTGEIGLEVTPNQDSPIMAGRIPIVGIDVWEHAYYLKYQNKRVDYVSAFMNVVNWDFATARYTKRS